ncbi:HDOD domain-containing protein [Pseudoalteromonas sp. CO325X]|uniref:HDOD domain-containing protein n=1 Tax=Pseudoalteromonas sp. CO325X TaxID=1777262 RepID=UPI00102356BE|nr:HDOD domain-containing protein [Pseudoalteromonas sp. CO325X]RZF81031.1 HDOD domain-containing protein [Pseudoalteromonas sp. CO325X]
MVTKTEQIRQRVDALEQRFNDLLLGHSFAQQQIGFIKTFDIQYGKPLKQRTLLEVEQAAHSQRQKQSSEKLQFTAKVSTKLHAIIENAINEQLHNADNLYSEVLGIQDAVPTILDILGAKAASVGRLEPLVNDLSWLGRELVTLVNLPQYRQERANRGVKIDTPALAIRYLGLDNLRLTIPTYAMRHWLPHSTEPFSLLKRKLRESAMSRAIAAYELAQLQGLNPYSAYIAALFLDLGRVALTRLYLRLFQQIWQRKVALARDEGNKRLHDALIAIEPDPLYLRNLFVERSLEITRSLVEKMGFRYIGLNALLDDFALVEASEQSGLAQVLVHASCYSQYLMLHEHQLIEDDERTLWFNYVGLQSDHVQHLEKTNLHNLALQIDG